MDEVKQFYEKVFGSERKFNLKKFFAENTLAIVMAAVDIAVLIGEYRVFQVGYRLTHDIMLAIGFVLVSSVPFFIGQLAYIYYKANTIQQIIAIVLVVMGLAVSAYFGISDYIIASNVALLTSSGEAVPIDINSLYYVAIAATIALIVLGLIYALVDDNIAATIRAKRVEGKAMVAEYELSLKSRLVEKLRALREKEGKLRSSYGGDYDHVDRQFDGGRRPFDKGGN